MNDINLKSSRADIIDGALEYTDHLEHKLKNLQQQRDTIVFVGAVVLLLYLI